MERDHEMHFLGEMLAQQWYLERRKKELERRLCKMPEGKLVEKRARGHSFFYIANSGKLLSLRKNPGLKVLYEEKERLIKELKDLNRDLPVLTRLMQQYIPLPLEETLRQIQGKPWEEVEAQQNPFSSQDRELLYLGVYYKSKSEMLIAVMLTSFELEFKYEVAVREGMRKVYPDFAIRRPKDGKIFYWEHGGLTNKPEYICKLHERLDDYHEQDINLWDNLILSFDEPDGGLNMDYIEKIIQLYLL